ncbi:MAG: general secretion pathway protein GspB [Xanthomonadales bacterium]|nr:general secretion pathway protein GspB [Xanthomonadales bacterium]
MSLILEALKKSEAERQRGRAPGLLDLQLRAPRRRSKAGLLTVLSALVLAAVGAGYGFALLRAPAEAPLAAAAPAPSAVAEAAPAPSAPTATAAPEHAAAAESKDAESATPASRLPSDPGFDSVEREARPQLAVALTDPVATAQTPAPAASVPPPDASVDAPAAAPGAPLPATAAMPATSADPADAAQAAAEPAAPQAPTLAVAAERDSAASAPTAAGLEPVAPPAAPSDSPPPLSSLDHEARGRLPPLKVSMHVFAEDPAGRVVIIDGRRLREGDAMDSRLRLAEIRREGSVLELEGRRYLLPRP